MIPALTPHADTAVTSTPASAQNSLGKDDFLKLLVTQLTSQDPLNPLDSQDFSAQLAQFSTLEQITNVNSTLEDLVAAEKASSNASMVSLIGKEVDIAGNIFEYDSGQPINLSYSLDETADTVLVDIFDASGSLVTTLSGDTAQGTNLVVWDGFDGLGNLMASGAYSFSVRASDEAGNIVNSTTFTTGEVTDVLFEDNEAFAVVNGKKLAASEITRVSNKL